MLPSLLATGTNGVDQSAKHIGEITLSSSNLCNSVSTFLVSENGMGPALQNLSNASGFR